jgi:serine/threonine protein kinase
MSISPPAKLLELLQSLGLASEMQVRALAGRVRRMARDLPLFDSLWVDALLQARLITPFQAAEINAGRGESLCVGPYVLAQRLDWPLFAAGYRARHVEGGEDVVLAIVEVPAARQREVAGRLEALAQRCGELETEGIAAIRAVGAIGGRRYIVTRWVGGVSAAQWAVRQGHFPAGAVEEILRQMAQSLVHLEKKGLSHDDVSSHSLILTPGGNAVLVAPGLRGLVRPEEGFAQLDLRPEAYEFLAPERVAQGKAPNISSDIFACGCVGWHLLTGRPAVPGGSSLATLRGVEAAAIADVRGWAPAVPPALAEIIAACLQKVPEKRPESMARLAARLGSPTVAGRAALRRWVSGSGSRSFQPPVAAVRPFVRQTLYMAVAAAAALVVLAALAGKLPSRRSNSSKPEALARDAIAGPSLALQAPKTVTSLAIQASTMRDTPVLPVSHSEADEEQIVMLSGSVKLDTLILRPGQRIVGRKGTRATISVPAGGWSIRAEGVRFENLDFVWDAGDANAWSQVSLALVRLEVGRAAFHGCTFRGPDSGGPRPAAIAWLSPSAAATSPNTLWSGRVELTDCLVWGVDAAVDIRAAGTLSVEINNTLFAYGGPLVRSDHCPTAEEPLSLSLSRVTMRQCGAVWQCNCPHVESRPGPVTIQAVQSVLVPLPQMPLIVFRGPESPERLWAGLQWLGEGSIVGAATPTAEWSTGQGSPHALDDSGIPMAGLVRSEVQFAGAVTMDPQTSQAIGWQVPLRTPDPPGIEPRAIPAGLPGNR